MKNLLLLLGALLILGSAQAQTDYQGNPVFNSVSVRTIPLGDSLLLLSNYYTLVHNLDNPKSSVYIREHPSLQEIQEAALRLPSNHFILTRHDSVLALLVLRPLPGPDTGFEFGLIRPGLEEGSREPVSLSGKITQQRAEELIRNHYDSTAVSRNGYIRFNGKNFRILPESDIQKAALALITQKQLLTAKATNLMVLPRERIYEMIRAQSTHGGELDFWKDITDKNSTDGVQVEKGVYAQRIHAAYYQWGKSAAINGIESYEDAVLLIRKIHPEIQKRQLEYLKLGFDKGFGYE